MLFVIKPQLDMYDSLMHIETPGKASAMPFFNGTKRAHSWTPIAVARTGARLRAKRGKPVDFPSMGAEAIAVSKRAARALRPLCAGRIGLSELRFAAAYYALTV